MTVVVDANILIIGIINPYGTIPELIALKSPHIDLVIPVYAIEEINLHKSRICKVAGIAPLQFEEVFQFFLSNIFSFSADAVKDTHLDAAEELVASIDAKDALYVAFSIALDALLWTGDLRLYKGLRKKGFNKVVTTTEINEIIKGLI